MFGPYGLAAVLLLGTTSVVMMILAMGWDPNGRGTVLLHITALASVLTGAAQRVEGYVLSDGIGFVAAAIVIAGTV
ncbi:MAG: hypothetical protein V1685_04335, partial [Parcubacteria group bacterium]